ncbi:hypothetical protein L1887_14516 [Cichorium endivia]|nr:hypothetical protein L1887_14516 [Cichorium endivia]
MLTIDALFSSYDFGGIGFRRNSQTGFFSPEECVTVEFHCLLHAPMFQWVYYRKKAQGPVHGVNFNRSEGVCCFTQDEALRGITMVCKIGRANQV